MNMFRWRYILRVTGLAAACFLTGYMTLLFSYSDIHSSVFWPPAGIALAAVLLLGYPVWPGIVLGHMALAIVSDLHIVAITAITLGSTLAALVGAWMLQRTRFDPRLRSVADVLLLLVLGGMIPAGISATLGTLGTVFGANVGSPQNSDWLHWWMGDTAGVLIVAPILLLFGAERALQTHERRVEAVATLLLLAIVYWACFGNWSLLKASSLVLLVFVPFAFLIWVAMRLHLRWMTIAILMMASIPLAGTALGEGPFVRESDTQSQTLLWALVAVGGFMSLLLGVGVSAHRRARDQFHLIIEANPNAIVLTNSAGRITRVNRRCKALFGYESDELIGQPVELLLPERLGVRHVRHRTDYMTEPQPRPMGIELDLFAVGKNGTEIPVEVGLAPLTLDNDKGVLVAISDISERKRAQDSLRQERNFVTAVLDTTDALVLVLDQQWRVVRYNKTCEIISGYSYNEVQGRSFAELGLVPDEELEGVLSVFEGPTAGNHHHTWENHWRSKEGVLHLISWSNSLMRDPEGNIEYRICTGIDITERRRAENDLQHWQARLAHIDCLVTATEMASGLAHELNQPLTAIINYCDVAQALAQSAPIPTVELDHVLLQASSQAQRAGAIINHLRGFVSKAASGRAWVDLNLLIRETLGFVEADICKKGGTIHLELTERLPRLWLDKVLIEQVLVNLLRNACEAMDSANSKVRQISIRTDLVEPAKVQVSVQDTGPGLVGTGSAQVFKAFESTKPEGLGMGLSISRSIVEAHGGRLWADPREDGGGRFIFTLPVNENEVAP